MRAVTLYRGSGRRLDDGRLKLTIGGTVYVALGGSFTATGCLFRDQDQTLSSAREEMRHMLDWRSRTFGGVIFVAGGNVYLNGCESIERYHSWDDKRLIDLTRIFLLTTTLCIHCTSATGYFIRVRLLGNFILNSVQVGRDILVIAGNVVGACSHSNNSMRSDHTRPTIPQSPFPFQGAKRRVQPEREPLRPERDCGQRDGRPRGHGLMGGRDAVQRGWCADAMGVRHAKCTHTLRTSLD